MHKAVLGATSTTSLEGLAPSSASFTKDIAVLSLHAA